MYFFLKTWRHLKVHSNPLCGDLKIHSSVVHVSRRKKNQLKVDFQSSLRRKSLPPFTKAPLAVQLAPPFLTLWLGNDIGQLMKRLIHFTWRDACREKKAANTWGICLCVFVCIVTLLEIMTEKNTSFKKYKKSSLLNVAQLPAGTH